MLFGITGAHRSGKTTLARALAEDLDLNFYETSTTKVAQEIGIDPIAPMSLAERLYLQHHLLVNHVKTINEAKRPIITDRTPLDYFAYLAAEFGMNSDKMVDEDIQVKAAQFMCDCLAAVKMHYDFIFYLAPLPHYETDPTKPAANPAYLNHIDTLIVGAIAQLNNTMNTIRIYNPDFEHRREVIHDLIVERLDTISAMRKSATYLC